MKGFAAVFGRELAERRLIPLVALAFGVVAVLLPLVPGLDRLGVPTADLRVGAAANFALLLSGGLALLLGGSAVAGDLSERRIGFYFSRPITGWSIWAGKMAAVSVLAFGAALLVLLPTILAGGMDLGGLWPVGGVGTDLFTLLASFCALVLFLQLAAHAVSVILRSRSPWIVLDVAALGAFAALMAMAVQRLTFEGLGARPWSAGGGTLLLGFEVLMFLLSIGILFAAGAVQVIQGRTDIRRGHRFLSATLWGLLLALALSFDLTSRWAVAAGPDDLVDAPFATAAAEGSWIAMAGQAAHRPSFTPGFLYDVASGRSVRTRFGLLIKAWELPVRFSADGRRVVWLEYRDRPFASPVALYSLDLGRPQASPRRTLLPVESVTLPDGFDLSPDGRRVATLQNNRLLVIDRASGRNLLSIPCPGESWGSRLFFTGPDRIRVYRFDSSGSIYLGPGREEGGGLNILELDPVAKRLVKTGFLPAGSPASGWTLSPDFRRVIVRSRHGLELRDARTGQLLAGLGRARGGAATFLGDGGVGVMQSVAGGWELRFLSPDGRFELRRFRLGGARMVAPVDSPAPGLLRTVISRAADPGQPWEVRVFDPASGVSSSEGMRRLASLGSSFEPEAKPIRFKDTAGVVFYDPSKGQPRAVLAPGPRSPR